MVYEWIMMVRGGHVTGVNCAVLGLAVLRFSASFSRLIYGCPITDMGTQEQNFATPW